MAMAANLAFLGGCNKPSEETVDESVVGEIPVIDVEDVVQEEAVEEDIKEITVSESALPEYEWQKEATSYKDAAGSGTVPLLLQPQQFCHAASRRLCR